MKKEDVFNYINKNVKVTLCNGKRYRGKLVKEIEGRNWLTVKPNDEYSFLSRHVIEIEVER